MKRSRRRLFVIILVPAIIAAAILGLVAYGQHRRRAIREEIEAELSRIREAGRPTTIEDLRKPRIDNAENAAIVYERAFKQVHLTDQERMVLWGLVSHPDEEHSAVRRKTARELVERHKEALELLEKGTRLPSCRFDAHWEEGLGVDPPLRDANSLLELLHARILLNALEGKRQEAIADMRTALHFCASVYGQPGSYADFVIRDLERESTAILQSSCFMSELTAEDVETLAMDLAVLRRIDFLPYILATMRVLDLQSLNLIRAKYYTLREVGDGDDNWFAEMRWRIHIDWDREKLDCVRYYRRAEEIADRPLYEVLDEIEDIDEPAIEKMYFSKDSVFFRLLVYSTMRERWEARACRQALLDITRIGLAAKAYRLQNGHWPESPPLALVDPFDGKPIRYRAEGDEVVIWSVGEDLDDDGGTPWDHSAGDGDIVWRIKPLAASRPSAPPERE